MSANTDTLTAQRRAQLAATLVARLRASSPSPGAPDRRSPGEGRRGGPLNLKSQISNLKSRERPILFAAPLVRAILDNRKHLTRRPIQPQPHRAPNPDTCPFGLSGDRLFLREKWGYHAQFMNPRAKPAPPFVYAADGNPDHAKRLAWKTSLHMPRAACRALLTITSVRAERLTRITRGDAVAEGCPPDRIADPIPWFRQVWDAFYASRNLGWRNNPWVWVITFDVTLIPTNSIKPRAEASSDAPGLFA